MIRKDISRLRYNRALHFQIGLVASLLFSLLTINLTVEDIPHKSPIYDIPDEEIIFDVDRTMHPKPKDPPPPEPPKVEVFTPVPTPDPVVFDPAPKPELKPVEADVNTKSVKKPVVPKVKPPLPKKKMPDDIPVSIWALETMPKFGNCDDIKGEKAKRVCSEKNLLEYIYTKIKYPSIARENGIEGQVAVSFVIDKDGSIIAPKVVRDIGGGCGKEVLRILNDMPKWSPGKQRGRPVKVQYNLPVVFNLER